MFLPRVVYAGFAEGIPDDWIGVECLYYEQRGWLRSWGKGQLALIEQGRVQLSAMHWRDAERTFLRARMLGDTMPLALEGQAEALSRASRAQEARLIRAELQRRWPEHISGALLSP